MKILLVEDNLDLAEQLSDALHTQRYTVDMVADGQQAWNLVQCSDYNLILLDVMLPGMDGIHLCRRIRTSGKQMPILLMTARGTNEDKVLGLDSGADDYVVKPVGLGELMARIRALLRRGSTTHKLLLEWGSLQLDPSSQTVTYGDRPLDLTPREYKLVELFLRDSNRVFSRAFILEQLWSIDKDLPTEDTIKSHIKGLRSKLRAVGAANLIETLYGSGYRLNPAYLKAPPLEVAAYQSSSPKPLVKTAAPRFIGLRDAAPRFIDSRDAAPRCTEPAFQTALLIVVGQAQAQSNPQLNALVEALVAEAQLWDMRVAIAPCLKSAREQMKDFVPDVILCNSSEVVSEKANFNAFMEFMYQFHELPMLVWSHALTWEERLTLTRLGIQGWIDQSATAFHTLTKLTQILQQKQRSHPTLLLVEPNSSTAKTRGSKQLPTQNWSQNNLKDALESYSFQVYHLEDVELLWQTLEQVQPELLIFNSGQNIDSYHPRASHLRILELCKSIRLDSQWQGLPILLIAETDPSITSFEAGVDDYFTTSPQTPIHIPTIVSSILNRLERRRAQRNLVALQSQPGIYNISQARQALENALHLAQQYQYPFCLIRLSLSPLQTLPLSISGAISGATLSHSQNNPQQRALQAVTQRLQQNASPETIIAEWLNEELIIGLHRRSSGEGIDWLASLLEDLRATASASSSTALALFNIQAGVAQFPQDGMTLPLLLQVSQCALALARRWETDCILPTDWHPPASAQICPDVLLVHSDVAISELIGRSLSLRGHSYNCIHSGTAALECLTSTKTKLKPGVILLSDDLPDHSGLEILKQLSRKKITSQSRVIMLLQDVHQAEKILKLGAFDYLAFPCSNAVIIPRIIRALRS